MPERDTPLDLDYLLTDKEVTLDNIDSVAQMLGGLAFQSLENISNYADPKSIQLIEADVKTAADAFLGKDPDVRVLPWNKDMLPQSLAARLSIQDTDPTLIVQAALHSFLQEIVEAVKQAVDEDDPSEDNWRPILHAIIDKYARYFMDFPDDF